MVFTLVVSLQAKVGEEANIIAKLKEAAAIYKKDPETIDWIITQDVEDPTKFGIIERYEQASSLKIHTANPFYTEFVEYVGPRVQGAFSILKYNEL